MRALRGRERLENAQQQAQHTQSRVIETRSHVWQKTAKSSEIRSAEVQNEAAEADESNFEHSSPIEGSVA